MSRISLIKLINYLGPTVNNNRYGLILGRPFLDTTPSPTAIRCCNYSNTSGGVGDGDGVCVTNTRGIIRAYSGENNSTNCFKNNKNRAGSSQTNNIIDEKINAHSDIRNNPDINNNKANPEQLLVLEQKLVAVLPHFFNSAHDYSIYTNDLIFIDNIRGTRAHGLTQYALVISLVKFYHALRYSANSLEILNLVKNPEESYIRIRWRITSSPSIIQMWLHFWKARKMNTWKDGISTMHVNMEGKVYCHVCDNIDVQTDDIIGKREQSLKNPLVSRGLDV